MPRLLRTPVLSLILIAVLPAWTLAQRGGANSPFPGGENPDGSLKPTARLQRLFSQDAYTEYALLEPGTEQFRIRFLTEEIARRARRSSSTRRAAAAKAPTSRSTIRAPASRCRSRTRSRAKRTPFTRSSRRRCPPAASDAC